MNYCVHLSAQPGHWIYLPLWTTPTPPLSVNPSYTRAQLNGDILGQPAFPHSRSLHFIVREISHFTTEKKKSIENDIPKINCAFESEFYVRALLSKIDIRAYYQLKL